MYCVQLYFIALHSIANPELIITVIINTDVGACTVCINQIHVVAYSLQHFLVSFLLSKNSNQQKYSGKQYSAEQLALWNA